MKNKKSIDKKRIKYRIRIENEGKERRKNEMIKMSKNAVTVDTAHTHQTVVQSN